MILLDTDHVTHLEYSTGVRSIFLRQRLDALPALEIVGVTVITVEEQMRGWLASIARERSVQRQVGRAAEQFDALRGWARWT